jgi:hypothetical protein
MTNVTKRTLKKSLSMMRSFSRCPDSCLSAPSYTSNSHASLFFSFFLITMAIIILFRSLSFNVEKKIKIVLSFSFLYRRREEGGRHVQPSFIFFFYAIILFFLILWRIELQQNSTLVLYDGTRMNELRRLVFFNIILFLQIGSGNR